MHVCYGRVCRCVRVCAFIRVLAPHNSALLFILFAVLAAINSCCCCRIMSVSHRTSIVAATDYRVVAQQVCVDPFLRVLALHMRVCCVCDDT